MKENQYVKRIRRKSLIFLAIGIPLLTFGLVRYLFFKPELGINLMTELPTIIDGSIPLVFGLLFILGGIHTYMNIGKLARKMENDDVERRKDARNSPKWLKHY